MLNPAAEGLGDFITHDEVYTGFYVVPDAGVLTATDDPRNDPQVAWIRGYGHSRASYFMLGHGSRA